MKNPAHSAASMANINFGETVGAHIIWQAHGSYMGCFMPKTGSSAWMNYMRKQITGEVAGKDTPTHEPFHTNGVKWGFSDEALKMPFRFAVVRHPWDRLVSFYRNVFLHDVRQGGGLYTSQLGFSKEELQNLTFHRVVQAIAEKAGVNGTDFLVNPHFRPQYQLCQLHSIKYHMLLNLDNLASVPEELSLVQQWTGFAERFQPHITCSAAQRGEPCHPHTVRYAKQVYGRDAELMGFNFDAAYAACRDQRHSAVRFHSAAALQAAKVDDVGLDQRFCNDCQMGTCPLEVCPEACYPWPLRHNRTRLRPPLTPTNS